MTVTHWSPILGAGNSLDTCFPLFIQTKASSLGQITSASLIYEVCKSFGRLCTDGDLCGGYRIIVTHVCMDGKAAVEAFNLPWSYKNVSHDPNQEICHLCFATLGGPRSYARFFDDFGDGERDSDNYMESVFGRASPWTQLPGFRLDMIGPEVMHAGPLGACLYGAGSLLLELCQSGFFGIPARGPITWKQRLQFQLSLAYLDFKAFNRRHGKRCSQGKFKVARLSLTTQNGMPYLKAKASNAMHICEWLSDCARRQVVQHPSEYGQVRACMAWGMASFFKIIKSGGCPCLTCSELQKLREARNAFLGNYHQLRALNEEQGRPLYPLTPKFHLLAHAESMAQKSKLNPTLFWAFKDEDQMQVMQRIALSAHSSVVETTAIEKWIMQWFEHFQEFVLGVSGNANS